MSENGIQTSRPETARTARELAERATDLGEDFQAIIRDLSAPLELELPQMQAVSTNKKQGFVGDAGGLSVASEGELGEMVESSKEGRKMGMDFGRGEQGEALASLAFDIQPSLANQGAMVAIGGAHLVEDPCQAFVREQGSAICIFTTTR